jgi:hypothetical protein
LDSRKQNRNAKTSIYGHHGHARQVIIFISLELESFQDILIELDMKPRMHIVETSIFSLNNVTARLTKIMNNLLEHIKILIFKVIFSVLKIDRIFQKKKSFENIGLGDRF